MAAAGSLHLRPLRGVGGEVYVERSLSAVLTERVTLQQPAHQAITQEFHTAMGIVLEDSRLADYYDGKDLPSGAPRPRSDMWINFSTGVITVRRGKEIRNLKISDLQLGAQGDQKLAQLANICERAVSIYNRSLRQTEKAYKPSMLTEADVECTRFDRLNSAEACARLGRSDLPSKGIEVAKATFQRNLLQCKTPREAEILTQHTRAMMSMHHEYRAAFELLEYRFQGEIQRRTYQIQEEQSSPRPDRAKISGLRYQLQKAQDQLRKIREHKAEIEQFDFYGMSKVLKERAKMLAEIEEEGFGVGCTKEQMKKAQRAIEQEIAVDHAPTKRSKRPPFSKLSGDPAYVKAYSQRISGMLFTKHEKRILGLKQEQTLEEALVMRPVMMLASPSISLEFPKEVFKDLGPEVTEYLSQVHGAAMQRAQVIASHDTTSSASLLTVERGALKLPDMTIQRQNPGQQAQTYSYSECHLERKNHQWVLTRRHPRDSGRRIIVPNGVKTAIDQLLFPDTMLQGAHLERHHRRLFTSCSQEAQFDSSVQVLARYKQPFNGNIQLSRIASLGDRSQHYLRATLSEDQTEVIRGEDPTVPGGIQLPKLFYPPPPAAQAGAGAGAGAGAAI